MLKMVTQMANRGLLIIATLSLASMMLIIALDVMMRYFFNSPIPGAFELSEYLMAILVPLSIPYCAELKGHVAVDFVYERLSRPFQFLLDFCTTLVSMAVAGAIAWQGSGYIGEVYRSQLTSAVLKLPAFYFVIPTAVGMTVFTLVLLYQLFELLSASAGKVEVGELAEIKKSEGN